MKINCKKCFFGRVRKDQFSIIIDCYKSLNEKSDKTMTKSPEKCESFGNLNKAQELWKDKDQYNWNEFGTDKRTAHYRTTKKIKNAEADAYLTIYVWIETQTAWSIGASDEILNTFYWERSLVHYKDGSFKIHKFRSNLKEVNRFSNPFF